MASAAAATRFERGASRDSAASIAVAQALDSGLARLARQAAALGVHPVEDAGQRSFATSSRLMPLRELRLVERAQDQHVEGRRHAVEVVVVPDRIRQAVEVVGRPERLGDLLGQAVAHVLGRGVERQEDRRLPERLLVGQRTRASARRRRKPCQSVSPGTMKQAAVGKISEICSAGTICRRICAASGSPVSAMSMPASARSRWMSSARSGR